MQQQSGPGNGVPRRALSPGPGGSDSEDSDISLGGTSPPSPNSSPPPTHHQPSPVPLGPLGPLGPPPTLNFHFDPSQSQFRFGHATAFKFPPASFRFGPHSPQPHNHPSIGGGGIFRLTETSPFQAVGPRGDLGSRYAPFVLTHCQRKLCSHEKKPNSRFSCQDSDTCQKRREFTFKRQVPMYVCIFMLFYICQWFEKF